MFMRGCPRELEDKRDRINRRELLMRNLLALSAGVRRTVCWNLAPDIPGYEDPLSVMDLLFGKLPLLGYEGTELTVRHPSAETFTMLADQLAGVERVTQAEVPGRPSLRLFEWTAATGAPAGGVGPARLLHRRGPAAGAPRLTLAAAGGERRRRVRPRQPAELGDGRLRLQVSASPLFVPAA
jgi:hypothetical protein